MKMYKHLAFTKYIAVAMLVFLCNHCFATKPVWYLSPAAAYGITPSYNISPAGDDKKIGVMYRAGVHIACRINEHISLGTGFGISHYTYYMGYKKDVQVVNRQEQSYVEIPLYITWMQQQRRKKGLSPYWYVTGGILCSHLTNAVYHETAAGGGYTEGGNSRDFRPDPAKILLHGGIGQQLWQHGDLVLGLEFTSLFTDNVYRPSTVRFLPGSLATAAVRIGFNIWL